MPYIRLFSHRRESLIQMASALIIKRSCLLLQLHLHWNIRLKYFSHFYNCIKIFSFASNVCICVFIDCVCLKLNSYNNWKLNQNCSARVKLSCHVVVYIAVYYTITGSGMSHYIMFWCHKWRLSLLFFMIASESPCSIFVIRCLNGFQVRFNSGNWNICINRKMILSCVKSWFKLF